jgi:hypothetical protein
MSVFPRLAVFSLALAGLTFAQSSPIATLTASDAGVNGGFLGTSVAISGSTVAAGAPSAFVTNQTSGVVYVFTKSANEPWADSTEQARLVAPAIGLGTQVAMSGDGSVIVAATHGVGTQGASDTLYLYVKPALGWKGTLSPNVTLTLDSPPVPWVDQGQFGGVAINATGTVIVAGAPNAGYKAHFHDGQSVPAVPALGAAYIWMEPSLGWGATNSQLGQTVTIMPSDGQANDSFGKAVAAAANTVVVAATNALSTAGKVYLFQKPASGWLKRTSKFSSILAASDSQVGDNFGLFVAVGDSGSLVAVGTGRGCPSSSGPVYVFAKPAKAWPAMMSQTAELSSSDGALCFGEGLAAANDEIVVGAPASGGRQQPGAAYSFSKPPQGWMNQSLPASMIGGAGSGHFGLSSSIGGRTIAVGAPQTTVDDNPSAGAVYLFSN